MRDVIYNSLLRSEFSRGHWMVNNETRMTFEENRTKGKKENNSQRYSRDDTL